MYPITRRNIDASTAGREELFNRAKRPGVCLCFLLYSIMALSFSACSKTEDVQPDDQSAGEDGSGVGSSSADSDDNPCELSCRDYNVAQDSNLLNGVWRSEDDSAYFRVIESGVLYDVYDYHNRTPEFSRGTWCLSDTCESATIGGGRVFFRVEWEMEGDTILSCYFLENITDSVLVLIHSSGSIGIWDRVNDSDE